MASQSNITILLNFQESLTSDLDLYLFNSANSFMGWSNANNQVTQSYTEAVAANIPPGTYTVAVDAYSTPQTTPYTLDVYINKKNEAKVHDWYSFTLTARTTLNVSLIFDEARSDLDLYLFDQNTTALLSSSRNGVGLQEGFSITLDPGTYFVGVELANQWNANYTLMIQ